ncbi:MAG TPA: hypothetical protein VLA88_02930 [Candidatus Saccharimonadales bacterium]|nr:hypothetical protein [Candidatus Saccharimonadales bacterium]
MTGAPNTTQASAFAERLLTDGVERVNVWISIAGDAPYAKLAELEAFQASDTQDLHIQSVTSKTEDGKSYVVFSLCTEHGPHEKSAAQAVIDALAERFGLEFTDVQFVDSMPFDAAAFLARSVREFTHGVGGVFGVFTTIFQPQQPTRRPW